MSVGPSVRRSISSPVTPSLRRLLGASDAEYSALLDAPSHLYKRVCPSVRRSVRRYVTPSLRRLLGASDAEYLALFMRTRLKALSRVLHDWQTDELPELLTELLTN